MRLAMGEGGVGDDGVHVSSLHSQRFSSDSLSACLMKWKTLFIQNTESKM